MSIFLEWLTFIGDLLKWYVRLEPWEGGLRIWKGQTIVTIGPGFHWRVPILHTIYIQDMRTRISNCSTQTVQTKDGKSLTIGLALSYRIQELELLYKRLEHAEDMFQQLTMQAAVYEAAEHDMADLTAVSLATGASKRVRLQDKYGLRGVIILVTDFVQARPYRLITDQRYGTHGNALDLGEAGNFTGGDE